MELRHLRYFLVTAEELNITRAAEKLCIAQPPLSRQIKDLEEELGTPLFIRKPRSLELTEAGLQFQQYASRIVHLADKSVSDIKEMNTGLQGTLYIGIVEGQAPALVSQWIAAFHKKYPFVKYHVWNGNSDEVLARTKKGLCDLAVIMAPYNAEGFYGVEVYTEPWVAIMSESHPLAKDTADRVTLPELSDYELITPSRQSRKATLIERFSRFGKEPKIICSISNMLNAYELASQDVGIALYPAAAGMNTPVGTACRVKIIEPEIKASYVLVHSKKRELSQLAEKFLHAVLVDTGLTAHEDDV